jgi:hypothetical protein
VDLDIVGRAVESQHPGGAAGGPDEIHEDADRGGLAGTIRAEEPEDDARRHRQVDVNDPARCSIALGELLGLHGSNHVSMVPCGSRWH